MKSFRSIRARLVARILQSIYGLRQSVRLWNQKIVTFFTSLGFKALNTDPSILIWQDEEEGMIMVSVYVDNFLLASKHRKPLDRIKRKLKKEYNVKDLGEMKMIIG